MSSALSWIGRSFARSGLLVCLLTVAGLALPASALATVPSVVTETPFATTANTEIIQGTLDAHGLATTYWVKYAASNTTFCGGSTNSAPTSTQPVTFTYSDDNVHAVTVDINGLTSGGGYCAEILAHNSSNGTNGSTGGGIVDFQASVPSTVTTAVNATGVQQAVLDGTVDPASQQTSYFVMYDTADSTWCSTSGESGTPYQTSPESLGVSDGAPHQVTASITLQNAPTALAPNSDYCAAIAATDSWGTSAMLNSPQGFTTETPVTTTAVESTGATTAQLTGTVNPDGQSTQYYAEYDTVGSPWCQNNEAAGNPAPSMSTPEQTLGFVDQNSHNVVVNITGLLSGATYCFSLRSSDASLPMSDGGLVPPLTVGLPVVTLSTGPTPDTPNSAQVTGTISATGQPTSYEVQYDLQSSPWCENGGTQGNATYSTAVQDLPADEQDDNTYDVTVEMPNLPPGTPYCAVLAASNSSNGQNGSPAFTDTPVQDFTSGLAPALGTLSAQQLTPTESAVTGTVDPEDQGTTYEVDYDLATSPWCTGSGSPTDSTPDAAVEAPTDANAHTETIDLTNLVAGKAYCAALVSSNNSGSTTGTQMQFIAGQPTAVSTTAAPSSATSETLTGTVTPAGQPTNYYVAWDTESSLWCQGGGGDPAAASYQTAIAGEVGGADDDSVYPVAPAISQLAPGEQYCAEIVAANADGSASNWSAVQEFTAGYPFSVATSGAQVLSDTTAAVSGTVNPAGLATTYWVAYDVQSSDWCSSGGSSDDPGMSTTPVALPADTDNHAVSVSLAGLQPGTGYCAAIVAQNGDDGILDGAQVSFTTGGTAGVTGTTGTTGTGTGTSSPGRSAPSHMAIRGAAGTSPSGARVTASINPDGERTIYDLAFAPASARFCVSDGRKGVASRTSFQTMRETDFSAHTVSASVAGLNAGRRYCAQIIAQNASGQSATVITVFTTIGHPRLSDLHLSSSVLRTGGDGIRVLYRDSQFGTATFTVAHRAARCRERSDVCAGAVVGRVSHRARAGRDSFTFTGQLNGKPLTHGGYVLEAVIRNRWQLSSIRVTVAFSVR